MSKIFLGKSSSQKKRKGPKDDPIIPSSPSHSLPKPSRSSMSTPDLHHNHKSSASRTLIRFQDEQEILGSEEERSGDEAGFDGEEEEEESESDPEIGIETPPVRKKEKKRLSGLSKTGIPAEPPPNLQLSLSNCPSCFTTNYLPSDTTSAFCRFCGTKFVVREGGCLVGMAGMIGKGGVGEGNHSPRGGGTLGGSSKGHLKSEKESLHALTKKGEWKSLQDLLLFVPNPHKLINDENGSSPIIVACENGDEKVLGVLLSHGGDTSCTDTRNRTPLHISLQNNSELLCKRLVKHIIHPGDYFRKDRDSHSPLSLVCKGGNEKLTTVVVQGFLESLEQQETIGSELLLAALTIASETSCNIAFTLILTYATENVRKFSESKEKGGQTRGGGGKKRRGDRMSIFFDRMPISPPTEKGGWEGGKGGEEKGEGGEAGGGGGGGLMVPWLSGPLCVVSKDQIGRLMALQLVQQSQLHPPIEVGRGGGGKQGGGIVTSLCLSSLCLVEVPKELVVYTTLTTLDLSDNCLRCIPSFIDELPQLTKLDFSKNLLESVPLHLLTLNHLKKLDLSSNPLTRTPTVLRRLVQGGGSSTKQVLSYLSNTTRYAKWRDIKVMVLGDCGVGKTSLVKALKGSRKEQTLSSDQLKTKEKRKREYGKQKLTCSEGVEEGGDWEECGWEEEEGGGGGGEMGGNISVSLWEFEKRAAYQLWDFQARELRLSSLFLCAHSLCLICFDFNGPHHRLEYWMKVIKNSTHPRHPPVIFVGTHYDPIKHKSKEMGIIEEISRKFTKARYPNLKGLVLLDSLGGMGVSDLRQKIWDITSSCLMPLVPVVYSRLRSLLLLLKNNHQEPSKGDEDDNFSLFSFLSPSRYGVVSFDFLEKEVSYSLDLKGKDFIKALNFLNETGDIAYLNQMKQLVVLQPLLFHRLLQLILTGIKSYENGILRKSRISYFWRAFPEELHSMFWTLLEMSNITYRTRSKGKDSTLFLPYVLPDNRPNELLKKYWPKASPEGELQFGRVYQFEHLPLDFFYRLAVRALNIEGVNCFNNCFWRSGMLLEKGGGECLALVETTQNDYAITITVRVPNNNKNNNNTSNSPEINDTLNKEDDNSENSNANDIITSTTNSFKILLEELVEICEILLEGQYLSVKDSCNIYIPCSHCIAKRRMYMTPHMFKREECSRAIQSGNPFVYCCNIPSRMVRIDRMAPDIALTSVDVIEKSNLQIKKQIGSGGFGVVYEGTLLESETGEIPVAIKELHRDEGTREGAFSQEKFDEFKQEVYIMSRLRHDCLVKLYGITVNPLQMVLELMPMGNLHNLLQKEEKISDQFILKVARDIALGMEYLHAMTPPIVHRDLRSLNVFLANLSNDPTIISAKVADFGMSRKVSIAISALGKTWQWLAPEVIDSESEHFDERSDIYSFGIVVWECITQQQPFAEFDKFMLPSIVEDGEKIFVWKEQQIKQAIVKEGLRPTIPSSLSPIIEQIIPILRDCWSHNPASRPSFQTIAKQLTSLLGEAPVLSPLPSPPSFPSTFSSASSPSVSPTASPLSTPLSSPLSPPFSPPLSPLPSPISIPLVRPLPISPSRSNSLLASPRSSSPRTASPSPRTRLCSPTNPSPRSILHSRSCLSPSSPTPRFRSPPHPRSSSPSPLLLRSHSRSRSLTEAIPRLSNSLSTPSDFEKRKEKGEREEEKKGEEGGRGGSSRSLRIKQVSSSMTMTKFVEEKEEGEGGIGKEGDGKGWRDGPGLLNMVAKMNIPQPDDDVFGQEAATALKKKSSVSAMCVVGDSLWLGMNSGHLQVWKFTLQNEKKMELPRLLQPRGTRVNDILFVEREYSLQRNGSVWCAYDDGFLFQIESNSLLIQQSYNADGMFKELLLVTTPLNDLILDPFNNKKHHPKSHKKTIPFLRKKKERNEKEKKKAKNFSSGTPSPSRPKKIPPRPDQDPSHEIKCSSSPSPCLYSFPSQPSPRGSPSTPPSSPPIFSSSGRRWGREGAATVYEGLEPRLIWLLAPDKNKIVILDTEGAEKMTVQVDCNPSCALQQGERVWVGGFCKIVVFGCPAANLIHEIVGHNDLVNSLVLGKNDSQIWSASNDGSVKVWDSQNFSPLQTLKAHSGRVFSLLSLNSRVLSGSFDKSIIIYDTVTQQPLQDWEEHTDSVNCLLPYDEGLAFNILSGGYDNQVVVWSFS